VNGLGVRIDKLMPEVVLVLKLGQSKTSSNTAAGVRAAATRITREATLSDADPEIVYTRYIALECGR